ncbi:hypothetical protein [Prochlorococcus marinus]|uniref:Uncharacterized protein n=1 Tax=Prochlorococcus marinus XMU1408 TaxID=2213228 RepID=A0A318R2I2_PROMR|nr:hypothetical protein [Prochlorococcus marinus]MBW3042407.1 hypothetical protein [Prochlorococcus marinus str. XMU1408]PYE01141.1 hypothetical protein DNJ73_06850 [Prochlorococcus marinus XMU1408]
MIDQTDYVDEVLKEKIKNLLDEDNKTKKWSEGLWIKSLILFPIIIFIVGLFIVNRPEKLTDILLVSLYPLALISIGLIILFGMRANFK